MLNDLKRCFLLNTKQTILLKDVKIECAFGIYR